MNKLDSILVKYSNNKDHAIVPLTPDEVSFLLTVLNDNLVLKEELELYKELYQKLKDE